MKQHFVAALGAALILSACGGGTSGTNTGTGMGTPPEPIPTPSPTPSPTPDPSGTPSAPTSAGTPIGTPVSAVIGPSGGALAAADGSLRIEVPAGAFATDKTVSIQEITNEAHGAKGRAYRISPEGLHTPLPMTLHFNYTDDNLAGTTLDLLRIAYQNTNGVWHVYTTPAVDTANRTLSVQTNHFSDWSVVAGAQILPHSATVKTGQSLELRVVHCEADETGPLEENGDLHVPALAECKPSPLDAYETSAWSVNGTEGGSFGYGIIVPNSDRWSGKATYTAPVTKPTPNEVSVSAKHTLDAGEPGAMRLLVANITIEDDATGCDGLLSVDRFNAELSFDSFSFSQSGENRRYQGTHYGRLVGTLSRLINSGPNTPDSGIVVWATYYSPLTGQFSMNDSDVYTPPSGDGFSASFVASGSPHDGFDAPSYIMLKLHRDTCTFDLISSFVAGGTFTYNGAVSQGVYSGGGLALYGLAVSSEQAGTRSLQGIRAVSLAKDPAQTGYAPPNAVNFDTQEGGTTAYWSIAPTQ